MESMIVTKLSGAGRLSLMILAFLLLPMVAAADDAESRLVVLGFDGADARTVERWIDEGKLPNLARLRESGSYLRLEPTVPAQTPVSWSSFSTGLSPGGTAIFDFLKRDPETYMPTFAVADEGSEPLYFGEKNPAVFGTAAGAAVFLVVLLAGGLATGSFGIAAIVAALLGVGAGAGTHWFVKDRLPTQRPTVTNNRQGITFWEAAGQAGRKARIVRVPVTFPPREFPNGQLLSGLGVPDIRGRIGTPSYYTSEISFSTRDANEFSVEIVELFDNRGRIETEVVGPPDKLFGDGSKSIRTPMVLNVPESRDRLEIEVGESNLTLEPGQWSEWVPITFAFNETVNVVAVGRFHLYEVRPEVKLYLSPLHLHPGRLPFGLAITHPEEWSDDLYEKFGMYKTMGWAVDTWSISENVMDEETFLEDVEMTVTKYREMLQESLKDESLDLLVQVFEFTDRVGHIFWRLVDETHPMYDAELARHWGDALLRCYQLMDEVVGDVMPLVEKGEVELVVCSDHGFSTWHRSINTNTWLALNGYIALKGDDSGIRDLEDLFGKGEFWPNVDWSRTRAYALGLGGLYINLKGREAQGIVEPGEEYELLVKELQEGLKAWTDEETGKQPVASVYRRDDIYPSYDPRLVPDLFVANSEGYRISWQTSLGGMPKQLIEINEQKWSGDHCSLDPPEVPGILFSSRHLKADKATITDLAPTILRMLDVPDPQPMDGKPLL